MDIVEELASKWHIFTVGLTSYRFRPDTVDIFYAEHVGKDFYPFHRDFLCSGKVHAIHLIGVDAISRLRTAIGHYQPIYADPDSLRFRYGTVAPANAVHGSDSAEAAKRELEFFNFKV